MKEVLTAGFRGQTDDWEVGVVVIGQHTWMGTIGDEKVEHCYVNSA